MNASVIKMETTQARQEGRKTHLGADKIAASNKVNYVIIVHFDVVDQNQLVFRLQPAHPIHTIR